MSRNKQSKVQRACSMSARHETSVVVLERNLCSICTAPSSQYNSLASVTTYSTAHSSQPIYTVTMAYTIYIYILFYLLNYCWRQLYQLTHTHDTRSRNQRHKSTPFFWCRFLVRVSCIGISGTGFVWYQILAPIRTLFYSKPESGVHVTEMMAYEVMTSICFNVFSCSPLRWNIDN